MKQKLGLFFFLGLQLLLLDACTSEHVVKQFSEDPSGLNFGIDFQNDLTPTDSQNIIQNLYFYNGGGVAIGDINNDTFPDIYLTSNQGENQLYLNQGDFQFKNISSSALPSHVEDWSTGVVMADVNNDGWLDIYTSCVSGVKGYRGQNRLLINQKDLTFKDLGAEAGLDFKVNGTQAAFFDYDNDGDLDMYLLCHSFKDGEVYKDVSIRGEADAQAGDRLYKSLLKESGALSFEDVTQSAGIYSSKVGFGLDISISDINNDGWQDIYVGNDFHENDYVYINNQNGTFKESSNDMLPHGSTFSMGNDIADVNNDGLLDIMTLDMKPADYDTYKRSSGVDAYDVYNYKLRFGYTNQYSQNCFFLNNGTDVFSDISQIAGVGATDWSWSVLLEDYDHDGLKDIFITNGIMRRPNDLDYLTYISSDIAQNEFTDIELTDPMPSGSIRNYFFKNRSAATFDDVTEEWSGLANDLSTGAATADLDLDGDLDIVANRIGEQALILQNNATDNNYLIIDTKPENRSEFLGARIMLNTGDRVLTDIIKSNQGFLSSSEPIGHFGLGAMDRIDELSVQWPSGSITKLKDVAVNQRLIVSPEGDKAPVVVVKDDCNLYSISNSDLAHTENDYTDFRNEKLIPFSMSTMGPAVTVGDVNGDNISDVFIGNATGIRDQLYLGDSDSTYRLVEEGMPSISATYESVDAVFADIDGDDDLDLFVVTGGNDQSANSIYHQDRVFLNDGSGHFEHAKGRISNYNSNGSVVRSADIDSDGDIDFFIGARSVSSQYGLPPKSYFLINDGSGFFNAQQVDAGMVADAAWADMDGDDINDLVVASEWEDLTIYLNTEDGFKKKVIPKTSGLWRSLSLADLNKDGELDIIAGNVGLNLPFTASKAFPLELYVHDFNNNGSTEPVMAVYDSGALYPYEHRDNLGSQIPRLKRKFKTHESFAAADMKTVFGDQLDKAINYKAGMLGTSIFLSDGNGEFIQGALPVEAQYSSTDAIYIDDFNDDGNMDVLLGGNLYEVTPSIGRLDGSYGTLLLGDGTGKFNANDCKSMDKLRGQLRSFESLGNHRVIATFNNSSFRYITY